MLKFMLVRDAQLRPSIRAVQQRFSSLFREQISRVGTLAANMMAAPSGAASARPSTRCEEFADRALALCQPANRWFESFLHQGSSDDCAGRVCVGTATVHVKQVLI